VGSVVISRVQLELMWALSGLYEQGANPRFLGGNEPEHRIVLIIVETFSVDERCDQVGGRGHVVEVLPDLMGRHTRGSSILRPPS